MTKEPKKHRSSSKLNAKKLPVKQRRGAGILLHITSLPSLFGIGDLGPEAEKFAEFLNQSGQRYWQILPLNPTGEEQAYSPYSAVSGMAGNPLLISPEVMAKDGLVNTHDLKKFQVANHGKVDYKVAALVREALFEKGFRTFLSNGPAHAPFREFCKREAYWLDDYALYVVLKDHHDNKPWYEWPTPYKQRQEKALGDINRFHMEHINKVKWLQYTFDKQWKELKAFCNNLNVFMFGDLPFYVSYDSADVWSHPEIFRLDNARNMTGIAGVPPDYFNAKGQLWGMPVFRWDVLKKKGYDWWVDRVRKNFELFDLVRDEFEFSGMKVLQFAFGANMTTSDYIPHNYTPNFVVYTGTHDNNTTVG